MGPTFPMWHGPITSLALACELDRNFGVHGWSPGIGSGIRCLWIVSSMCGIRRPLGGAEVDGWLYFLTSFKSNKFQISNLKIESCVPCSIELT